MSRVGVYFTATRPWSFTTSIVAILLGTSLAYNTCKVTSQPFSWLNFVLTLVGGLSIHITGNLLNTYYDFKHGLDKKETSGDRTLFDLNISPSEIFYFAMLTFFLALATGAYFVLSLPSNLAPQLFALFACGAALTIFYTAGPIKLKYRALGDLTIFLCFGPLLILGTVFLQTHRFLWGSILFSLPIGLLTEGILHVNNTRDIASDRRAKAITLANLLGERNSLYVFIALLLGAYALLFLLASQYARWLLLLPLLSAPLAISVINDFKQKKWGGNDLCAKTAQLGLLFGIFQVISIFLTNVSI
jgi:1,4-dihydroxy-2-naphthoate octaprenyltransferase